MRASRVLLVEDNPGDADLVKVALDDWDGGVFDLEHVMRLADALARVGERPAPDIVLLDLTLPDAFGLEGLQKLTQAAPQVPVVVLTGADRLLGAAAIQAGAQDYLLKGQADPALLPRALRHAIERHEQTSRALQLAAEQAARAAAEAGRERMSLLAAASMAVSHSLEDRHALASLASALVPRLADWCAIRNGSADEDGPEWIASHREADRGAAVRARLDALTGAPGSPTGAGAFGPGARAELHEDVARGSLPSDWKAALEELGADSTMIVPIRLADEILGVIVFAAHARRFAPDDLALAEEIGRRAGVAVANCRLYREARLAVAARDEFLSVAAHELRTPLTVLQLKLQQAVLKQQASVCGTCDRAVPVDYGAAARQISRLGQLIESLLDVSSLAAGPMDLRREEVDACELARGAVERFAELAARSRSELTLRCVGPVPGVWDRLAVERVLANLLSNALKFGDEKPVEVRVRADGTQAVIEVEDHGIGIAPEDVGRIFDQFERAVSARHFGGLGLGLYIARSLVERHGGKLTVASRPRSGSVFTVRLPRAAASPAAPLGS